MITYQSFCDTIRREIFPFPGEPQNQKPAHSKAFLEAMIELQKWVPCLRAHHTSVFAACATYVQCGLSVVEAPVGEIRRVYTIANGDFCDPVYYSGRGHKEVLQWQRGLMLTFQTPTNTNLPALQQGFKFAEASTDSPAGRARTGIWSINRKRFHLAPWLQSNESLVIEWDGIKTIWDGADLLDQNYWTPDVAAVVKLYVQKSHERDFGCDRQRQRDLEIEYAAKLGDLMYWCKQRTQNQENLDAEELNVRGPTSEEAADDEPIAVSDSEIVGLIADYGNLGVGSNVAGVAQLVRNWSPAYIVTAGDNWYGITQGETDSASLDASVGQFYSEFIYPYLGGFGSGGQTAQRFFPAFGNHDRDPAARTEVFKNYFNMGKEYYDFVRGHIHWFIVDTGYNNAETQMQADGNTATSIQGEWLKLRMALSTSRWKIVVFHHPPYASQAQTGKPAQDIASGFRQYPAMRWPFKQWGADAVICGHSHVYERLAPPEGYPLFIIGWSGASVDHPAMPGHSPYSVFGYEDDYGAVRLTASCDELKFEAFNVSGVLIDTLQLTKA